MKAKSIILIWAIAISNCLVGQSVIKNFEAHSGSINKIKVSPDGNRIITTGADARTNLWDAESYKRLKIYKGYSESVSAISFDNTAKIFVTEGSNGKLVVWDLIDYTPLKVLDCKGEKLTNLTTDPFNKFIAGGTSEKIFVWNFAGKIEKTFEGFESPIVDFFFSPDGKYIIIGNTDDLITIYNTKVWEKKGQVQLKLKGLTALSINPDGKTFAATGKNGMVYLCNIQDQKVLKQEKVTKQEITNIKYTIDGKKLILSTLNKFLSFNTENDEVEDLYLNAEKTIVDFAMDNNQGILYTAFADGEVSLLEFENLKGLEKVIVERNGSTLMNLSNAKFNDKNENGLLEQNETGELVFYAENTGESPIFGATLKIATTNEIGGLDIPMKYYLGNLDVGQMQRVKMKISGTEELESASTSIILRVFEDDKILNQPLMYDISTRGTDIPSYLIVEDYILTTPTGKIELGIPVTLRLLVRNITNFNSQQAKLKFKFPNNVVALDKVFEDLSGIKPNESRELSVQFMPQKEFAESSINIGFEIEGLAYSNIDDIDFDLEVNSEVTKQQTGELAFVKTETKEQTAKYRGGGDPLMGLNVSYSEDDLSVGNYYALIIGVDKYQGSWQPLQNAVSDARALKQVLSEKYTFGNVTSLFNEEATRENIIGELEKLVNSVSQSDNVLIYYSGHGEYNESLQKGFWVPSDATTSSTAKYISNSDIQTYLGGIKSRHTLLISDACFSGDIFRGNVVTVPFEESIKYFSKVYNIASRKAITSGGIEPVLDGGKDGHSVFAYYLLKALNNNSEKYLDASQLYESVKIPVINNSEQTPRYNPIKNTGDEGGQFIFINK
jgi:hypothetical protein